MNAPSKLFYSCPRRVKSRRSKEARPSCFSLHYKYVESGGILLWQGQRCYQVSKDARKSAEMPTLARKLRLTDYFTLAFGTMVGVGWLVLMDDWLGRGGPLGAALGFALGGLLLLPVGDLYGQWVPSFADAASEAAYTAQDFPALVRLFIRCVRLH